MKASMLIAKSHSVELWSLAFRPFFLDASLWSAVALALWIGLFITGGSLPSQFDPLTLHIHAMLFGFVYAAIAGFTLTAIPNCTGRPPIRGAALAGLVAVWLLGRIICLVSMLVPLWLATAIELTFPFPLPALRCCRSRNLRCARLAQFDDAHPDRRAWDC